MKTFRRSRNAPGVLQCVDLTARQVRALPRIPSGFTTDAVYHLVRRESDDGVSWDLRLAEGRAFTKVYDNGNPREWLDPYFGETPEGRVRYIGVERDGAVLGLVTFTESHWNDTIWLMDIRVREEARGEGAGSALMAEMQERARLSGVRGIWLETQINNVPALRFYRKHGFRISGFNDHLYANDDLERQDIALYMFWERR
jgi:ribosomal protein S18 acetylase RimI-like enzyme